MERKNQLQVVERHAWGGSSFDFLTHSAMFQKYKPFNFGVKGAQLYSSKLGSHLINKKFTYYTVAKGNVYMLPGGVDDYEWYLKSNTDIDFRISELLVDPTSFPGKGKMPFKIALDRGWLHEPVLLKSESPNLPLLRVLGYPAQRSVNSFEYEVELQTSDMNSYIPVSYLQPGRRFIDVSTSVTDNLNYKFAGDQYGEMFKLQSFVGNFARKVEFDDKFIRAEIAARKTGGRVPKMAGYSIDGKSYMDGAVGKGYVYQESFSKDPSDRKKVEVGVFIPIAVARMEERLMRDREMNFEFGQLERTVDRDTSKPLKVAPGWRQLVRDGHFMIHNGSLTLSKLYEYIASIFITRRDHSDRKIKLASGEGGIEFFHRLIAQEASQFQYIDTLFTTKRNDPLGYHENELEYGAQFTKLRLPMGYVLELVYDPIKDDRQLFPQLAEGTNRTVESYAMDIFDFGATDQKAMDSTREENISCVMQDGVESFFAVSNVYDFETGAEKNGGNVYSLNKESGMYRETSGGMAIWDITRCGRIEYQPYALV
jgi:hypothetical protein